MKKQPREVSVYPAVFLSSYFPEDQRPEVVPYMGPRRVHIVAGTQEKQKQNFSSSFSVLLSHGFGGLPLASGQSHHSTHTSSKWVLVTAGVSHRSLHFSCVTSPRADLLKGHQQFC